MSRMVQSPLRKNKEKVVVGIGLITLFCFQASFLRQEQAAKQASSNRTNDFPPETTAKAVVAGTEETTTNLKKNALGNGHYYVFLDVGANIGIRGRFV